MISDEQVQKARESFEAIEEQLRQDRGSIYGPIDVNHEGIGLMWTAIIHQVYGDRVLPVPIPGWAVALMMATLKCNRLAASPTHEDSVNDAKVYLGIMSELASEEFKGNG